MIRKIKSILSIVLTIAVILGTVTAVPVSAEANTYSLPYFFTDFEDGDVHIFDGTYSKPHEIADTGYGASPKSAKLTAPTGIQPDWKIGNSGYNMSPYKAPAGSVWMASFWIKLEKPWATNNIQLYIPNKIGTSDTQTNTLVSPTVALDKTSTEWQKLTFRYAVTSETTFTGYLELRMYNNSLAEVPEGETYGERVVYVDDFEMKILAPEGSRPVSNSLTPTATVYAGDTATFTHDCTIAEGRTDASQIYLYEVGKPAVVAKGTVAEGIIVPASMEGKSIYFSVIPIDSEGALGETVTYDVISLGAPLTASMELSEFAADENSNYYVTATATLENHKASGEAMNTVLFVILLDAEDGIVAKGFEKLVCGNDETETVELTVVADNADFPSAVKAKAFLWNCGAEENPTPMNSVMSELAPMVEKTNSLAMN